MKKFLCLFWASVAAAFAQTPSVTNVSYDSLDHGVVRLLFATSGEANNSGFIYARIRYAVSPATCTGGSGGAIQPAGSTSYNGNHEYAVVLGGLTAATAYQACPEISNDGSNWSSGMGVTFTTLALPAIHPVPPIPPQTFATDIASTTNNLTGHNYTTGSSSGAYQALNMNSSCQDPTTGATSLLQEIGYAISGTTGVSAQNINGTVIQIPPGAICNGPLEVTTVPPDVLSFSSTNVNTSTSTINIANCCGSGHEITEGEGIIFSANYGCLPGSNGNYPQCFAEAAAGSNQATVGPLLRGYLFYAHVIDSNDFQVYEYSPQAHGGTQVTFGSFAGSGTMYVAPFPRQLNWIIVRTSTPDSQFAPEHTRVSPSWAPLMPQLVLPANYSASSVSGPFFHYGTGNAPLLSFGDLNSAFPIANIRFLGVELTYGNHPEAYTSSDPLAWIDLFSTGQWNQDIWCDRCYFHAPGTPVRVSDAIYWDGLDEAIVDSYFDGLDLFHSAYLGLGLSQTSSTSFTVTPNSGANSPVIYSQPAPTHVGEYHFGAGSGSLASTATFSWAGTPTSGAQQRAFVYFPIQNYNASSNSATGQLVAVFPPGITATCSGATNCLAVTGDTEAPGSGYNTWGGTTVYSSDTWYYTDPVFSTASSCTSTETLFQNSQAGTTLFTPSGVGNAQVSYGIRFLSTTAGYVCGFRFYKAPNDTATTHTIQVWDDANNLLGTFTSSGETSQGWQQVNFSSPVAMAANQKYNVLWQTNWFYYSNHFWQNLPFNNGQHLYVNAAYTNSNGSGNFSDAWPKDGMGNPAAGYLGYIDISSSGTIAAIGNTNTGQESAANTEGCQCMNASFGPGPYVFSDNYVEGSGNVWQYDQGAVVNNGYWGQSLGAPQNFTYTRNYWKVLPSHYWQGPSSDGMRYFHRQIQEWKGGSRFIKLDGNIYDGNMADVTDASIFIEGAAHFSPPPYYGSATGGSFTGDESITNNTFMHGPGGVNGNGIYEGTLGVASPGIHMLFQNNLLLDINGYAYCAGTNNCAQTGGGGAPGWLFQGLSDEDMIIAHNTVVGNVGLKPSILDVGDRYAEGVSVHDNIFYVTTGANGSTIIDYGVSQEGANWTTQVCTPGGTGESAANCALRPSYQWYNNVMVPAYGSASALKSAWPNHGSSNYFPSSNSPNVGFFSYSGGSGGGDFHLQNTSPYISGGSARASDGGDVGANMDQLLAAQGAVMLNGVSGITSSSATVAFVAPDSAGCSVDYSSSDPTVMTHFTRVPDAGGARTRKITLSGLAGRTVYYYRVNCSVQQPTGEFHTN